MPSHLPLIAKLVDVDDALALPSSRPLSTDIVISSLFHPGVNAPYADMDLVISPDADSISDTSELFHFPVALSYVASDPLRTVVFVLALLFRPPVASLNL
jgi:hypothetical protein